MGKKDSFWIPYADLMTVLMIVFLFISIAYMAILQKKEAQRNEIVNSYIETKHQLYQELQHKFEKDLKRWSLELGEDLSIKFTNPDVLFESGQATITTHFKEILNEFIPQYFQILLDNKYKDQISEIRIEGHTDDVGFANASDSYIRNVELSQARARNVLAYIRQLPYYTSLGLENEELIRFLLTANGLSSGRTLDSKKNYTYTSKAEVDKRNSRRVEFKIVTKSSDILEKISNK